MPTLLVESARSISSFRRWLAALPVLLTMLMPTGAAAQLDADFTADPTSGLNPLTVDFADASTGATIVEWRWNFGDGSFSTDQDPTHTYMVTETTSFTVTLTVIDDGGAADAETKLDFITVDPAPLVADFTADPTQGTNPLQVAFTDASAGATVTGWRWTFGDGSGSLEQNPTHVYSVAETMSFTVTLETTALGGEVSTETKADFITVDPAPLIADFTADPTQGPDPLQVAFSDASSGAVLTGWRWNFGDGSGSTEQNPTHTYLVDETTSFTVTLETTALGGEKDTETKVDLITVDPTPLVVDFTATPTEGFNLLEVAFTDTSTGANLTGWRWDFGDGSFSTEQDPTHTYTAAQTTSFTVTLSAFAAGESGTTTKVDFITVDPAPLVASFAASPTAGLGPLEVAFTDTSTGSAFTAWSWRLGDGTISTEQNPIHTYVLPGTYSVQLTAFAGVQRAFAFERDFITVLEPFTQHVISDAADGAWAAYAEDLNADSDPDVIVASSEDDTIAWYASPDNMTELSGGFVPGRGGFVLGEFHDEPAPPQGGEDESAAGEEGFGPEQVITTEADFAAAVYSTDLNGDGDPDVLSASRDDGKIAWYENTDGMGTFGPQQVITDTAAGARSVHAVDLDGDGDADVLSAAGSVIAWYENTDGLGTFGPGQAITTNAFGANDVYAVDLEADGDADVLSASGADDTIAYYVNDGMGNFGPKITLSNQSLGARSVHASDLNGTGFPEVLTASELDDTIAFHRNFSFFGFPFIFPETIITTEADGAMSAFAADLDGDGENDVLSASRLDDTIAWYENLGGLNGFGPPQVLTASADAARSVFARDLDADGDVDVLGASSNDDTVAWFENPLVSPALPSLGNGLAGSAGIPVLTGRGGAGGEPLTLTLTGARPGTSSALVIGLSRIDAPYRGGVLVPSPDVVQGGAATDTSGRLVIEIPWPADMRPGTTVYFQHWIIDPAAPLGLAASNGLSATSPR